MQHTTWYPGTPHHQALLQRIVAYYEDDPRILALTLFGSLARGTWDQFSDLDLDVVVRDDVSIDVLAEVQNLCATFAPLHEHAILIVPDREDAADVVLTSLHELSIRYHVLATTSPNIVESVQLLCGSIPIEQIKIAGVANTHRSSIQADPFDTFMRLALAVDRTLYRRQLWHALPLLDALRAIVVEAFARSKGGGRPYTIFQVHAPRDLRDRLGATLPQPTLQSVQGAFLRLLDLVEEQYGQLTGGHDLSQGQHMILTNVRQRQQALHLSPDDH